MPRALAYAKDLAARRRNGERVGLLVVSVGDWEAGKWYEGRPEVCRVMLPADVAPAEADWSVAIALDVLVCGSAPDAVFYAACDALHRAGAASLWGDFEGGFYRLEHHPSPTGKFPNWVSVGDGIPLQKLGAAVKAYREQAILQRIGVYGSQKYKAAREGLIDAIPGLRALIENHEVAA